MDYCNYFKDKKITIMGLGLLGRGVNVAKFLAECGADLIVTDLKGSIELAKSLSELRKYKNITFVLGKHRPQDFRARDFILKAAGVPLDSVYIRQARRHNIPIEMDASLFVKLANDINVIGVTGTRGKSTTTQLIYSILKKAKRRVYIGGNVRGIATLPLLKKIKSGDYVVLELDSWQLQGFGDGKISPHIAIFTNFTPDHLNYYKGSMRRYFTDKENIYKYQQKNDYIICGKDVAWKIRSKSKKIIFTKNDVPKNYSVKLPGEHNRTNAASAISVADILGIQRAITKSVLENFNGVPGRLEFVRKIGEISYYNDTTATTPVATTAALSVLGEQKNIILIAGGTDKNLDYKDLVQHIMKTVKMLILFSGSATDKIVRLLPRGFSYEKAKNMSVSIEKAKTLAGAGDIILLSPAAASFGLFVNEFDRGDQFVNEVKKLK